MKTHYRGSVVEFDAQFKTTDGTVLPTTGATLSITHPLDGFPLREGTYTASYDMVNTSTVYWTYEYNWDSSPSAGGYVSWNIQPASTAGVSKSGQFLIKSNPAATWVHGPSTAISNDE